MTNINELKDALKDTLEEKGVLNEIRAMMRSAIYSSLENDDKKKPNLTDENLLINELIKEYMRYNNYHHSLSVFVSESGQPKEPPFDRNFIAKELNVLEDSNSKRLPLLHSLIFGLKRENYEPPYEVNKNIMSQNSMPMNFSINNNFQQSQNFNNTKNNEMYLNQSQPKPLHFD